MDTISCPSGTSSSAPAEDVYFSVVLSGCARRREERENTAAFLAADFNVPPESVLPILRKAASMPMIAYTEKTKGEACSIARRIRDLGTPCYVVAGENPLGTRVPLDPGELPEEEPHGLLSRLRGFWK